MQICSYASDISSFVWYVACVISFLIDILIWEWCYILHSVLILLLQIENDTEHVGIAQEVRIYLQKEY
jgi:hypothetical protein